MIGTAYEVACILVKVVYRVGKWLLVTPAVVGPDPEEAGEPTGAASPRSARRERQAEATSAGLGRRAGGVVRDTAVPCDGTPDNDETGASSGGNAWYPDGSQRPARIVTREGPGYRVHFYFKPGGHAVRRVVMVDFLALRERFGVEHATALRSRLGFGTKRPPGRSRVPDVKWGRIVLPEALVDWDSPYDLPALSMIDRTLVEVERFIGAADLPALAVDDAATQAAEAKTGATARAKSKARATAKTATTVKATAGGGDPVAAWPWDVASAAESARPRSLARASDVPTARHAARAGDAGATGDTVAAMDAAGGAEAGADRRDVAVATGNDHPAGVRRAAVRGIGGTSAPVSGSVGVSPGPVPDGDPGERATARRRRVKAAAADDLWGHPTRVQEDPTGSNSDVPGGLRTAPAGDGDRTHMAPVPAASSLSPATATATAGGGPAGSVPAAPDGDPLSSTDDIANAPSAPWDVSDEEEGYGPRAFVGVLVESGLAERIALSSGRRFNAFFADLYSDGIVVRYTGADLQRALKHVGARPGDRVELIYHGSVPLTGGKLRKKLWTAHVLEKSGTSGGA
jgi:hypothetical protein